MNYECLCKISRWLFARLPRVLIERVAWSWKSLMRWEPLPPFPAVQLRGFRETNGIRETHDRESLQRYDSTCYLDRTIIYDTVAILRTETLWREPDSIGNIYPLMTVNTETSSKRQTQNNITSTRIDTLYITDNTDDVATETSTSCRDARPWGATVPRSSAATVPRSFAATVPRSSAAGLSTVLLTTFAFILLTIAVVIVVKLLRRFSFP